jgi:hypothetical protein
MGAVVVKAERLPVRPVRRPPPARHPLNPLIPTARPKATMSRSDALAVYQLSTNDYQLIFYG